MISLIKILLLCSIFIFNGCANIISYQMTKPIKGAKMQSEVLSDMEMFYYTLGNENNPPLIFLHGILAFTEIYKSFLISLSDQFYIIGIDLPGHGRSSAPSDNYDIYRMGEVVVSLTKKLGLDSFFLVGHSMGGLVTLLICERYPENVIKAVSIASLYNASGINFANKRYDFLSERGFQKNSGDHNNFLLEVFNLSYKRINESEKFNKTKMILEDYQSDLYPQISEEQLKLIKVPILVVVAEKDQLIKPKHTRKMCEFLPHGTLISFPNANHGNIIGNKRNILNLKKSITYYFGV